MAMPTFAQLVVPGILKLFNYAVLDFDVSPSRCSVGLLVEEEREPRETEAAGAAG